MDDKTNLPPLPSGVEAMTKQQLWEWFQRSTRAWGELSAVRRFYLEASSGLHPCYARRGIPDPYETIELQRKRIETLQRVRGQETRGYAKKIRKLQDELKARNACRGDPVGDS